MRLVSMMVGGSAVTALIITTLTGVDTRLAIWLGMIGPLAVSVTEWLVTSRTYRQRPEGLTSVRIKLFLGKIVFFGAYIAAIIGAGWVLPVPFVISLTGYFLTFHVTEAVAMHRMLLAPK